MRESSSAFRVFVKNEITCQHLKKDHAISHNNLDLAPQDPPSRMARLNIPTWAPSGIDITCWLCGHLSVPAPLRKLESSF